MCACWRVPGLQALGRLVALAAGLGAASFCAAVIGQTTTGGTGHLARVLATLLPAVLMAVCIHFLLSVPDGQLLSRSRRTEVVLGYAAGLALGLWAWFGPGRLTDPVAVAGWSVAIAVGVAAAARRYSSAPGIDRQRMQTLAAGAVASVEVGLVVLGLAALVDWPGHPWAVAAGATVMVPIGVGASTFPRLLGRSDRILVWLLTLTGLSVVVLAVYLLVILGFGHQPGSGDRQVLGLSILAAAIVALGASISHQRVQEVAQRLVYGTNAVPDDVVKTFSTRLTRAVTMDELLLQLTESLHKSMALTSAEVFTGTSEVLERSASIPDQGPGTLHIGPQEQPIVARSGVSGNAWTAVWLPSVIAGRDHAQLRVCPITYGGDLLGLVVVERPDHRTAVHREGGHRPHRAVPPGGSGPSQRPAWTRPCSRPSTKCGARQPSCAPPRSRSWPRPTPRDGGWNATSTTVPSNTWWRWRSMSGWSATWSARTLRRLPRRSTRSPSRSRPPCRSFGTWPTASTRHC